MDLLDLTVTLSRGAYSLELTDPWSLQSGCIGLDDAEQSVPMDSSPGVFGGFASGVQVPQRRILLPVLINTDGGAAWQAARRTLRQVRKATAGATRISVRQTDATTRVIDAWPVVEPAQWASDQWGAWGMQRLGLDFLAERPWWRGMGELSASWGLDEGEAFLDDVDPTHGPDELAHLADSAVLGATVVLDVPGDEDTWPTWTVTGVKGVLTVVHEETGRSWTIGLSGVADAVTLVTDPTVASASSSAGADLWSRIDPPFDLWPLPPGPQSITVTMTGADSTTQIAVVADGQYQAAA